MYLFKVYYIFSCHFDRLDEFLVKQARKGFRPPSAMKGIGYFQNLKNLLRNSLEIVLDFFGNYLGIF